ncbi:MAG TPA: phosphotransferase [Gammaproteobacteria bacterium]
MTREASNLPDPAVLEAFGLVPGGARPAESGLINRTWHVVSAGGEPRVLQRVNPIFPPAVNEDIDALTRHLAARGLATPRLVPTLNGRLWLEHAGAVWRVLTAVPGVTHDALAAPDQAREAGRVLAAFHRAVADFDRPLRNARLGVHDTPAQLAALRRALAEHSRHPAIEEAERLAARIFAHADRLATQPAAPDRVVHGDPKISNIVFDEATGRAVCLIDLDTLARMPVAIELGDAMRSWCNPGLEDSPDARLSLPSFEAAMTGYAESARGWLGEREWIAIPDATLTITVELAARFCADALADRYFAWDPNRYASRSAHNLARAAGQLALADSIGASMDALRAIVADAFRG